MVKPNVPEAHKSPAASWFVPVSFLIGRKIPGKLGVIIGGFFPPKADRLFLVSSGN